MTTLQTVTSNSGTYHSSMPPATSQPHEPSHHSSKIPAPIDAARPLQGSKRKPLAKRSISRRRPSAVMVTAYKIGQTSIPRVSSDDSLSLSPSELLHLPDSPTTPNAFETVGKHYQVTL